MTTFAHLYAQAKEELDTSLAYFSTSDLKHGHIGISAAILKTLRSLDKWEHVYCLKDRQIDTTALDKYPLKDREHYEKALESMKKIRKSSTAAYFRARRASLPIKTDQLITLSLDIKSPYSRNGYPIGEAVIAASNLAIVQYVVGLVVTTIDNKAREGKPDARLTFTFDGGEYDAGLINTILTRISEMAVKFNSPALEFITTYREENNEWPDLKDLLKAGKPQPFSKEEA